MNLQERAAKAIAESTKQKAARLVGLDPDIDEEERSDVEKFEPEKALVQVNLAEWRLALSAVPKESRDDRCKVMCAGVSQRKVGTASEVYVQARDVLHVCQLQPETEKKAVSAPTAKK